MAVVKVAAGEFVFPTGVVKYAGGSIGLVDNSGGSNQGKGGDGYYTVSINSGGTIIVTQGREPAQSSTLQHLAGAHVAGGVVRTIDRRMQNVTAATTNQAIMAEPDADGSPVAAGVVTKRTLDAALQEQIDASTAANAAAVSTLGALTDIDDTTEEPGYVLVATPSSDKPFSWTPRTDILSGPDAPTGLAENGTIYSRTASSEPPLYVAETTGPWPPTSSVGYSTAQLTDGAIAQYPLADAAGATVAANTKSGSAYGAGSYVGQGAPPNIASLIADQPSSKQFAVANQNRFVAPLTPESLATWSVEFVIAPASTSDQRIAGTSDTGGGVGWAFVWTPGGGLVVRLAFPDAVETITDSTLAFDGSTKHMVLTYDGTTYTLYVQGVAAGNYAGPSLTPCGGFCLGDTYEGSNVNGIDGGAAGVAFYGVALTAAQVATHYSAINSTGVDSETATTWVDVLAEGDGGAGATTLAALTDVDDSTEAAGWVLAATPSNGKPFSWIEPAAGGGGGVGIGYNAAILAEPALVHYWKCNEPAGATAAADTLGGAALEATSVGGEAGVVFGVPLLGDGEPGLVTDGAGSYLTIPGASIPSAGAFTWEMIVALLYAPGNYAFVGAFGPNVNNTIGLGANANFGEVELNLNPVSDTASLVQWTPQKLFHVALTYNGTTFIVYMGGVPIFSMPCAYGYPAGDGRLGMLAAGTHATIVRLGKLAVYSAALTPAKIAEHALASGLS